MDILEKVEDAFDKVEETLTGSTSENRIAKEKRTIEAQFVEIGRIYYEGHKENYGPEYEPMINIIKECEKNIEKEMVAKEPPKEVRVCNNCGKENSVVSKFCTGCGSPLNEENPTPEPSSMATNMCPNCGGTVEDGDKFCISCGTPLEPDSIPESTPKSETWAESNPMPSSIPEPEPDIPEITPDFEESPIEPVAKKEISCPRCGSVLSPGNSVCGNCGNQL